MARRIDVRVYESDGTTLVDTLESDNKRAFLKDLGDVGSFSLEVKLDHADEDVATDGRIVRYRVDGTSVWQGLIEKRQPVLADPQTRQAGRVMSISGRGTLAVLEQAPIYPELGLGLISPRTRFMNYASADFDDTAWSAAVEIKRQDAVAVAWANSPAGWQDPEAYWIWDTGGDVPPVDPGDVYFRKSFTIAAGFGGEYRFSFTADDGYRIFLDGDELAAEQRAGLWGVTRTVDVLLDEGTHVLAVQAINFDRPNPATNGAAFILTCHQLVGGGVGLGNVVVRTDDTWKMLAYPVVAPGMTPGQILDIFLTEAQANGFLAGLTWDFTEILDSDGTPWPSEPDLSFAVGTTTVLDVVRVLFDEHLAEVEMSPTGLVLSAYVSKGQDRSATVSGEYAENLSRLAFDITGPGPNVALSMTAEGRWVERERTASATTWGRRGVGLSLGSAPSSDAGDRQADAFFDDNSEPVEQITEFQLEEVSDVPLADFDTGDVIAATTSTGSTADCRVHSIRCSEDEAGNPVWNLELVKA